MTRRRCLSVASAACCLAAGVLVPPSHTAAAEVAAWLVRPAVLPFAWQARAEAKRAGDNDEVFARSQQILRLLPRWTDGHIAFAVDYAVADDRATREEAATAVAAERRLHVAMAWLDSARSTAGQREIELLQCLWLLPDLAVRQSPGLSARLLARGGAAALADPWLAAAERRFPTAAVREHRTFYAPALAASLLAAGDRDRALMVLLTAVERSAEVRQVELATEWRARLVEVMRALRGQAVDLSAVRADTRMAPLLPHLR